MNRPALDPIPQSRVQAAPIGFAFTLLAAVAALALPSPVVAQLPSQVTGEFFGLTTDGEKAPGLFEVEATGVTTQPVVDAARDYLATLDASQRAAVNFPLDSDEWRHWANFPQLVREGIPLRDMSEPQRAAAMALLDAGLSAKGLQQATDIMKVAGYVEDLMDDSSIYGENLYFVNVFGEPSSTEPWGWQIDGYHLVVNYFVMGDQVVMTPAFWGIEPAVIDEGPLAGTAVLQAEQDDGLTLMRSLNPEQQAAARIDDAKTGNDIQAAAFQDNREMAYEGIPGSELNAQQRELLMEVIGNYVRNLEEGHAEIHMDHIREHLDETHFAWIGDTGPEDVFYYRVHGPLVLIEFDHTIPVVLDPGNPRRPSREHIHSLIRTPNGNDYGKDLLRQHYEETAGDPNHTHGGPVD